LTKMLDSSLTDLDELVLACRNSRARIYISEAVVCYKNQAFRACVLVTWSAILFDIIEKIRELEASGDKEAKSFLEDFSRAETNNDKKKLLEIEREILTTVKSKFEFLSEVEVEELKRVQTDRNHAIHPTLQSGGEFWAPTAEMSRSHIKSAVKYLLQYEPVQGKAALDRLVEELSWTYYPLELPKLLEHYKGGPLNRARTSLINNFLDVLLKMALLEDEENRIVGSVRFYVS
jgi:hypothetical protein